jgi:long-chain acyl-CoA synthetase
VRDVGVNVVARIRAETAAWTGRTAMIDGGREIRYGELMEAVDLAAAALRGAGVGAADRVALLGEDGADYVIACLALLSVGAVVVPVSPALMRDELDAVLDRMGVRWLLLEDGTTPANDAGLVDLGAAVGRPFRLGRLGGPPLPRELAGLAPAFVRFSSGTTGASKGVVLSHATILARTDAADAGLRVVPTDVIPWVLSMSFHFVVTILLFLRRGATLIAAGSPFPEAFLEAVRRRRPTLLYASPLHYQLLATSPHVPREALGDVRLAVSTAVRLPESTADAFLQKFGIPLAEAYGIIEVGLPAINTPGAGWKRGALGRPLPGFEVRIADAGPEGVGEILVRGPGMFDAYLSPFRPRSACLDDGWFRTGDLGRLDGDGVLFLVGRRKAVINFAGMKVFPAEVEAVLNLHPDVQESCVYGAPHPLFGQIPCARVVLRAGAGRVASAELREFCRRSLALHKVPKQFEQVDRIAKTASGKVRRDTPDGAGAS